MWVLCPMAMDTALHTCDRCCNSSSDKNTRCICRCRITTSLEIRWLPFPLCTALFHNLRTACLMGKNSKKSWPHQHLSVFDSFRHASFIEVHERNKNWATGKAGGTFFVQDSCGKNSLILIYRKADQDMTITLTLPGRTAVQRTIHEAQQSAQSE